MSDEVDFGKFQLSVEHIFIPVVVGCDALGKKGLKRLCLVRLELPEGP